MQTTIQHIKDSLKRIYPSTEIRSLTNIVMQHTTGMSMPMILCDKSIKITADQETEIEKILKRLLQSEPIQYIIGETEFYDLMLNVRQGVLIPRPETEELIELILQDNTHQTPLKVLDIGTGSACIALSLKKHLQNATVYAWDISPDAIEIAKENADRNGLEVHFREVDVLGEYPENILFDIIVSNPPYVLESEKTNMDKHVLNYEPHLALFVEDDNALLFYKRIADIAQKLLTPEGTIYFEINALKGQETVDMLTQKGFKNSCLIKDLSQKDRIVKANR